MPAFILEIDDARWAAVLPQLHFDIYHTPQYAKLESQRICAEPYAFCVHDEGRIFFTPYLVRSCNRLFPEVTEPILDAVSPYGYSGVLTNELGRDKTFIQECLRLLDDSFKKQNICTAFIRMNPLLGCDVQECFESTGLTENGQTVIIDLEQDVPFMLMQMRRSLKQSLKKLKLLGVRARFARFSDVVDEFCEVYFETMDRVCASKEYYFDRPYLLQLSEIPGVYCCLVYYEDTLAAACVFFECEGIVTTHIGGTKNQFLSISPFALVMFEIMLWAKSRHNKWLQFGGGVGGNHDSLFHFKAGFSSGRASFYTLRLVTDEIKFSKLIQIVAQARKMDYETILASPFFPPYRG